MFGNWPCFCWMNTRMERTRGKQARAKEARVLNAWLKFGHFLILRMTCLNTPKALHISARGCATEERRSATPGGAKDGPTLKELHEPWLARRTRKLEWKVFA